MANQYQKQEYIDLKYVNQEKIDWDYLLQFSEAHPLWFERLEPGEYGTIFDGVSEDITGGTRVAEIKGRSESALKYMTIIIEDHKFERMKEMWKKCRIGSIYFNIFGNGSRFMLFDMPQIFESGVEIEKKKIPIKFDDNGEVKKKLEYRYFLPVEYAYQFDSDFKRVQDSTLGRTRKKCAAYVFDFNTSGGEISKKEMKGLCSTLR